MIIYKNILAKLKAAGYTTTRIRRENLLSEDTVNRLRHNKAISMNSLNTICKLTGLPIEDLIEYSDKEEETG